MPSELLEALIEINQHYCKIEAAVSPCQHVSDAASAKRKFSPYFSERLAHVIKKKP
jgi:hypothetical protein